MADINQPPWLPMKFTQLPPAQLGRTNPYTGPWEDGPGPFTNPINSATRVYYNGTTQVGIINIRNPKPPREWGPGATDPAISAAIGSSYNSDGYRDH